MARPLKAFSGWVIAPVRFDARHRDGRHQTQVQAAVSATGRKAAAAALTEALGSHYTVGFLTSYWSETTNQPTLDALAEHPAGTVLLHADHGGTIRGSDGWVVVDDATGAQPTSYEGSDG